MAYVLIEKDHNADADNVWKNISDESGKELVFASLEDVRAWVSANRVYADSVRSVEVPEDY